MVISISFTGRLAAQCSLEMV